MYFILTFVPFITTIFITVFNRYIGPLGIYKLSILILTGLSFLSLIGMYENGLNISTRIVLDNWIISEDINLKYEFLFDPLSTGMYFTISFISLVVFIFSKYYLADDPYLASYFNISFLFVSFMLLLVISSNWVLIFVCWEGVGLVSYLLINFWFTRRDSNLSAMQAIIINRFGDWAFLLAIFSINLFIGSLDFLSIFPILPIDNSALYFINLFLLFAACAKSAQLILHTWLPSAMAAPTPISSLLHAATMVTLGVYLLIRGSLILQGLSNILIIIFYIGALTSLIAAITGFSQFDMKKVIAYSTSSQIGYMFTSCGAQEYTVAFNHLINHAFFKAFLFINAGSLIHYLKDEQDFRNIGVLIKSNPYLHWAYLLGTLSLVAMPYYSGFYSKDLILENLAHSWSLALSGRIIYYFQLLTAVLTTIYCFRSYFFIFLNNTSSSFIKIQEGPILASLILSIPTLVAGYLLSDILVGVGSSYWNGSYMYIRENEVEEDELLVVTILILIIGIIIGYILTIRVNTNNNPFVFDQIYNNVASYLFIESKLMNQWIDKGLIEQFGYKSLSSLSKYFRYNTLDSGFLPNYLAFLLFGLIVITFIVN